MNQRAAQAELLFHPAGKLSGGPVFKSFEVGCPKKTCDPLLALLFALSEQQGEELRVLVNRERGIQILAQTLRHIRNPGAYFAALPPIAHVAFEHLYGSALDDPSACNQRKCARFADAVRADES